MLVTEFDSASVEICGFELPVEPGQMKMTWSIVGIATTTTLLLSPGFIPFYQVANGWWIPCLHPPSPSLTLAQSFVFFFFAVRSFEKFRGCTHTNMHVLIHVLCVWPSLSTRWKWGLSRSNLNLVFFLFFRLSREWVKGERGKGERILNLPFL